MKKMHYDTERTNKISKINDFSFSMTCENDWANIISSHEHSDRPSLWYFFKFRSGENKSITKQNVKIFEDN
jgi:hypothetical protein